MDGCVQCNSNPFQFLAYQAATAPWAGGAMPVGITTTSRWFCDKGMCVGRFVGD